MNPKRNKNDSTKTHVFKVLMIRGSDKGETDPKRPQVGTITFDVMHQDFQEDEPLIIKGTIAEISIHCIYIDHGIVVGVMYIHCFLILTARSLVSFTEQSIWLRERL